MVASWVVSPWIPCYPVTWFSLQVYRNLPVYHLFWFPPLRLPSPSVCHSYSYAAFHLACCMAVGSYGPWGLTGLARVDLVFSLVTMFSCGCPCTEECPCTYPSGDLLMSWGFCPGPCFGTGAVRGTLIVSLGTLVPCWASVVL